MTDISPSLATPPTAQASAPGAASGAVSGTVQVRTPLALVPALVETTEATRTGAFTQQRTINLPPGFGIKVFATGLDHVRMLSVGPDGTLYATVRAEDRIVSLPDLDRDGVADEVRTFAADLEGVHGLAFREGVVYAATEDEIFRLQDTDGDGAAETREVLVNDLPVGGVGRAGGNHTTRTLLFGPDGKLYVSIGSSCNACVETDTRRAAISRYTAEGEFEKVFARGLRNSVGIEFHPLTGELWAVNNGVDHLGEDLPPEGIYRLREGGDYGWPYCYGDRVPDPTQQVPPGYCESIEIPVLTLPAHSAPLGLAFYTGDQFPQEFRGDMFVGLHGSWYREGKRVGYKVVRVRFEDNQPDLAAGELLVEDFASGWLTDETTGEHWGRPVDPHVAPDGALFLTDDASMSIYKIYYKADQ